jgi:protein phosphatase
MESILGYFEPLEEITRENVSQELEHAILIAHNVIREQAKSDLLLEDMKATCVVLIILGNRAYWSHIGDSRLYLFRRGKLLHKTKDHSVVQVLLDMDEIEEEDVPGHPDRNRVLKTLGMEDDIKPEVFSECLKSGDDIVLCTDGFWEYYTDKELGERLGSSSLPVEKEIDRLFQHARTQAEKTKDNYDNLTLHLIRVI